MKKLEFIEKSGIEKSLISATVNALGEWNQFEISAIDISNHGIDGGYGDFVYYSDTVKFFRKNKKAIMAMAENLADDMGENILDMIANFNCMKSLDLSTYEISKAIHTGKGDCSDQILNCLAWFAGEEVCRSYADMTE